jgi:hypothetical protein
MEPNPYQSPRESGFSAPVDRAWRDWLRDRIALLGAAVAFQFFFTGGIMLLAWLTQ